MGETPTKNSLRIGTLGLALLALSVEPCAAWGEVGHRVVARIAAALLTLAARAKVATILEGSIDDANTEQLNQQLNQLIEEQLVVAGGKLAALLNAVSE